MVKKLICLLSLIALAACDQTPVTNVAPVGGTGLAVDGLPGTWGSYRTYTTCLNGVRYYIVKVRDGFSMAPVYSRSLAYPTKVNSAPDAC